METKFDLNKIQKLIRTHELNGWLFYDFQNLDAISSRLLSISLSTRRWYYFVPSRGAAVKIVHAVENQIFDHLPGKKEVYRTWEELRSQLGKTLGGLKTGDYNELTLTGYTTGGEAFIGTQDILVIDNVPVGAGGK